MLRVGVRAARVAAPLRYAAMHDDDLVHRPDALQRSCALFAPRTAHKAAAARCYNSAP